MNERSLIFSNHIVQNIKKTMRHRALNLENLRFSMALKNTKFLMRRGLLQALVFWMLGERPHLKTSRIKDSWWPSETKVSEGCGFLEAPRHNKIICSPHYSLLISSERLCLLPVDSVLLLYHNDKNLQILKIFSKINNVWKNLELDQKTEFFIKNGFSFYSN